MDYNNPFNPTWVSQGRQSQSQADNSEYFRTRQSDFSEIEAVLNEINNGWEFMTEDDFDPVTLALALMDDSSVGKGKDYAAFQAILEDLDAALESIIDSYYQGFNSSIVTFGGVVQHINDCHQRVADMKNGLRKCKGELLEKRTDLLNMWYKSEQLKETLNLLESIEDLRLTTEKLENLMNSKHVLSAARLLVESSKVAHSKEMMQIGALDDVRRTLAGQRNALHDLLIEELHNHLYLKSPFCDNLWSAHVPDQQFLPQPSIKPRSFGSQSPNSQTSGETKDKSESIFAVNNNDILTEDMDRNPETDSYYYIEIIMEALGVLGDVPLALETIRERLPLEIHLLVDKTILDVEERNTTQSINAKPYNERSTDEADIYVIDKASNDSKNEILKDLLWTLFSKMEAVLRALRFTETCARRIKKRTFPPEDVDGPRDNFPIFHFHEIWRPTQAEIQAILQDYLTTQERSDSSMQQIVDVSQNSNGFPSMREKSKQMFKFTETPEDPDLEKEYQNIRTNMFSSFKKKMPGFDLSSAPKYDPLLHSSIIDKYASDMAVKSHKLLVKPDAYNVSVLLRPTMSFLDRLKEVFPSYDDQNIEGFGSFLDDFAINVFLPQIEEKVMQLIHQATVGVDAFQDDPGYKNFSKYPIVKSATALNSVIQSLCRTMHTMPMHTEEYIRLIEVVLLKYYEKCYQRFYSSVARGNPYEGKSTGGNTAMDTNISASGNWAQDESLVALLAQNPYFNDDTRADFEFVKALNQAEITMELKLKDERQLQTDELILEPRNLTALGRLHHSLKWFVREIWDLRKPSQHVHGYDHNVMQNIQYNESSEVNQLQNRYRLNNGDESAFAMLPLREDAAKRFDTLLTTYQQLAETCLFTLRLEGRCHTLYYLEMAIRDGNYYLDDETYEPDPYIITLNSDLMEIDDCITSSLPPKDEMFAFDGLPMLMAHSLIAEAIYIKRMNSNGVQKMMRNILALQQNLSNFVPSSQITVLDHAREYYQLFLLGSEAIIRAINETGPRFTFDEYRVILGLIHDIKKENDDNEQTQGADSADITDNSSTSGYNQWLLKLDNAMAKYEV